VRSTFEPSTALELFEAAPCGYLLSDADGTIARVNQTFLRWTLYSNSDLIGRKRFQELLSPPAAIFYETHFAPLLQMQGFVKEIAVDIVCADGNTLPALINSTMQTDTAETATLTTVFDVTERRRYERQLLLERRKAEILASVVEGARDAIITTTRELRVATWNAGAIALFGYTAEEAIGRDLRELIVSPEDEEHAERQLAKLRSGESLQYETTRHDKSGRPVAVSVTVHPQIEPPNEIVGFSAIIRDVSERKRLERAQQASRDLELAHRLAHEINNPLQAISNCLAILFMERESEFVSIAQEHVVRIAQVVHDLVKLTRSLNP
jgi:PAS domain S-box-containing protein